jgi:hypothetical protein
MTVYEITSATIAMLGLAAVIASILLVWRQLHVMMRDQTRRFTDSLHISAESALDTQLLFVSRVYIDHSELRGLFNEGESPKERGLAPLSPHLLPMRPRRSYSTRWNVRSGLNVRGFRVRHCCGRG